MLTLIAERAKEYHNFKIKRAWLPDHRQRHIILDIILDEDCSCCKEIYYKACKQDSSIGAATVYRMVNTLEEIGAISRKNMYKFTGSDVDEELECVPCCRMELDDGTVLQLSDRKFRQVLTCGLESCGYMTGKRIVKYTNNPDRPPRACLGLFCYIA